MCGYGDDTTEELCARWAMLGAFTPFYRNHNAYPPVISQEYYLWESVTAAAKKTIDIRYRLLDYFYTALYQQTTDGTPLINPVFYLYPSDEATYGLDLQYFYGDALLVAPVTEQGATSVAVYLPDDVFYDWHTQAQIQGAGAYITVSNQSITDIPLYIRGGSIIPLRNESAMSTTELRTKDFTLLIAPDRNGTASGQLYIDDGVSLEQNATTLVRFAYADGKLVIEGEFGFGALVVSDVTLLGGGTAVVNQTEGVLFGEDGEALRFGVAKAISESFEMQLVAS